MTWDILGHEWAVNLLQEHVARDRLRHAYLLIGPRGVGRRTLALRLAQAVNCPQPAAAGDPCRVCRACLQIERMQYPDLTVVQAETEGGVLKVDQVRELQHSLALAPYEARYRVALLLRFEEAHASAANALLKTLEEPPAQVIMLLTASSQESLLPTIVSRCEPLRLRPLALEDVAQGLQTRWQAPEAQATLLAHLSGGRPGYALALYREPERLQQRQEWVQALFHLLKDGRVQRFNYIKELTKDSNKEKEKPRDRLRLVVLAWLPVWRDVLLRAAGSAAPLINPDLEADVARLASALGPQTARQIVANLDRSLELLDKNANPQLVGEVLMLDLPRF